MEIQLAGNLLRIAVYTNVERVFWHQSKSGILVDLFFPVLICSEVFLSCSVSNQLRAAYVKLPHHQTDFK